MQHGCQTNDDFVTGCGLTMSCNNVLVTALLTALIHDVVGRTAIALAPQSPATKRCTTCPAAERPSDLELELDILIETDVAQFYSYSAEGAILVYFVARAKFSHAPSQLQLNDFVVVKGNVLEIIAEDSCTQFLIKGSVQQDRAWIMDTTEITLSVKRGATVDCLGRAFPAANASSIASNNPIGSMYVPGVAYTAAGPISVSATNTIRLAFSQPIVGLAISQLNITLTAAPDTAAASPVSDPPASQEARPGSGLACVPGYSAQILPAIKNSSQYFNIFVTLPDCYYGLVTTKFVGQVTNAAGARSLPINPVGFNRVATRTPVTTVTPFESLPALGTPFGNSCS